jgi:hypothetical protein
MEKCVRRLVLFEVEQGKRAVSSRMIIPESIASLRGTCSEAVGQSDSF